MQKNPALGRLLALLTVLSLPLLVGSSCFFSFSSGGSGGVIIKDEDDDDDDEAEAIAPAAVQSGAFSHPIAQGIDYTSGSLRGVTGSRGEFEYVEGAAVRFSIGDIELGAPVEGKPVITPEDLAQAAGDDAAAATNIARLLHSLDADGQDAVVTIPPVVRSLAVRSNPSVAAAIEFLEYADEVAFTNAASQLVASLTKDYPHTARLVEGEGIDDAQTAPTSQRGGGQ